MSPRRDLGAEREPLVLLPRQGCSPQPAQPGLSAFPSASHFTDEQGGCSEVLLKQNVGSEGPYVGKISDKMWVPLLKFTSPSCVHCEDGAVEMMSSIWGELRPLGSLPSVNTHFPSSPVAEAGGWVTPADAGAL